MQYASNNNGERIEATPNAKAVCPACGSDVIAKCGAIKVWHWAHVTADCDPWYEGMTEWHIEWQSQFPAEYREVVIRNGDEVHRADIALPDGTIIEFQHSAISVDEIKRREAFYGEKMIWVFDASEPMRKGRFSLRQKGKYHTFRWKHPKLSIASTSRRKILDFGTDGLMDVRKMGQSTPCGGWGYMIDAVRFVDCPTDTVYQSELPSGAHVESWKVIYKAALLSAITSDADFAAWDMVRKLKSSGAPFKVAVEFIFQLKHESGLVMHFDIVDMLRRNGYDVGG